jgi:hypothetical protein
MLCCIGPVISILKDTSALAAAVALSVTAHPRSMQTIVGVCNLHGYLFAHCKSDECHSDFFEEGQGLKKCASV